MTQGAASAAAPRMRGRRVDLVQLFFNGAGRLGRLAFAAALGPVCVAARLAMGAEGFASWALWFLALVTVCTITSKRLHDLGLAGWWSAGPVALVAAAVNGEAPTTSAQAVAVIIAAGCFAALALWPGERRFNRFGPAPHSALPGEGRDPSHA